MLANGKYEFCVTGVMRKDRDGNLLKTKNGNTYVKVKLCILDSNNESHNVYDLVFNRDKIEQIVESFGKPELKTQSRNKDFKLEKLVGESGRCLTKIRPGKNGYSDSVGVECYLKPAGNTVWPVESRVQSQQCLNAGNVDDDSEVPF